MSNTGFTLELDIYIPTKKIAFEYQVTRIFVEFFYLFLEGKQHFQRNTFFFKSQNDFEINLERDKMKKEKCNELGIFLIFQ